ncbi:flippase [Eisenbergiella tayi]|uniref:flippase n=1 Tax=Eisenbergiella tayi TaxID=1432052 RepID=UPI000848F84C|nr:flippase [Eisenbergiella tayi]ODR35233.1 hypothetical protein BEI60_19425 [Eisenbergiella tayi]
MKNENKNFLFNIVYQILTFLIPLVTTPYISRVLGVTNVGIYSYTYSIVYMFMLVGMLGINNYGNRAVAIVRDNKKKMSHTFWAIYVLQLTIDIAMLVCYVIYLTFFCKENKDIAVIQGLFLLSVCFDINWFYFGIEKFKLTIFRNTFIKLLSLFLIFIFVKQKSDLWIYTLIMSGATLLSQIYLVVLLPKYVQLQKISFHDVVSNLKGIMILFMPVLAFGIYKVMDKTMIGALASVTELGYYENAEKLMNIPLAVISALGTVMLPRMSYLINNKEIDINKPITTSMTLAMKLATMMCLGLILISDEAVVVLFGKDFFNSAVILRFLSVTILASAWANVIRTQFLIPLKKDKIYIFSTIGAAIVNILFNLTFIPLYGALGACIGTIVAEFFVAIYQSVSTRLELSYRVFLKNAIVDLEKATFIVIVAYTVSFTVTSTLMKLLVKILISVFVFVILNRKYIKHDFLGK